MKMLRGRGLQCPRCSKTRGISKKCRCHECHSPTCNTRHMSILTAEWVQQQHVYRGGETKKGHTDCNQHSFGLAGIQARTEDNTTRREETERETDGTMIEYPLSEGERMYPCCLTEVAAVSYPLRCLILEVKGERNLLSLTE